MPFDLLEALGIVGEAASGLPDPRNRRERIGCLLALAVVVVVVVTLVLVSLI
jgi:hypothetical protein